MNKQCVRACVLMLHGLICVGVVALIRRATLTGASEVGVTHLPNSTLLLTESQWVWHSAIVLIVAMGILADKRMNAAGPFVEGVGLALTTVVAVAALAGLLAFVPL